MSSFALQAHLNPAGKILCDLLAFLPWDRFYCYCDFCFQVRNTLEVVDIDLVLKIYQEIKICGFKSCEYGDHLWLISRSEKHFFNHTNDSFEVCEVAYSCWNHQRTLITSFRRPSAVQNLQSTWTYRSVLIVTQYSLSFSKQNQSMMPCLDIETQEVHFTECNGLCRQCPGDMRPQKMVFLEFT